MITFKCKMCGGDIRAGDGQRYGTCDHCGGTMTLPNAADERRVNLFNRANHFRRQNDFDRALTAYENILSEDNSDAEAHWDVVLCRYGIEYVEDPTTHERVPTCRRVQYESVLSDANYLAALENAPDDYTYGLYEKEARTISEIQKGILAISQKENPFDVFICYKEATDGGNRTKDSVLAQDIYHRLTQAGHKTFFARITLEDKLGSAYEPYIFSALNSARVMLAVGTRLEHFNAVWVKNEWSRYLALMKKDRNRLLIPCYRDMDPYDLPEELSSLQSQDMGKLGFMQDLLRGVEKVLRAKKSEPEVSSAPALTAPGAASLYKRGTLFLEDGDWKQADEYFDRALDIDPEYAPAYMGKLCAELEIHTEQDLGDHVVLISDASNYKKALYFSDAAYRAKLEEYGQRSEAKRQEKLSFLQSMRKERSPYGIAAGSHHTVGLRSDRTVVAVGDNACFSNKTYFDNEYGVSDWKDIVAVSAGEDHTVGLSIEGTVFAVGTSRGYEMHGWKDIVAISVGGHTVGLRADGTVVAAGYNTNGECDVSDWRNIVAVSAGMRHTVGLRSDGTVIAAGNNTDGECNVSGWRDIIAVSAGGWHTVGLRSDGRVIAVGYDHLGQCNVSGWRDIVAIAPGGGHTVGLHTDGTVVAVGSNEHGRCNVSGWRDIIAISAAKQDYIAHTVGLRADGTVVAVGYNKDRQCNVSNWKDIGVDSDKIREHQERVKNWAAQGLCRYCGGNLKRRFPFFEKTCQSCERVN